MKVTVFIFTRIIHFTGLLEEVNGMMYIVARHIDTSVKKRLVNLYYSHILLCNDSSL